MGKSNRIRTIPCTVVIAASGTTANSADIASSLNGLIRGIYIDAPTLTGASYSITITGPASGQALFTKAALTANAKTNILSDASFAGGNAPLMLPIDGACTVTILSAGTEASQRTFNIKLLVEEGF